MASTTFENKLNAAIEEKGYRISPRLGLEDRLARYIELTWIDRGEPLTKDEVTAVVTLTMLNNFDDSAESQPRRSSRQSSHTVEDVADADDSWQPRRSARLATRETVNYAEDDSEDTWQPRRSTRTDSHPMVRRSQMTRR